jgi:hypothetical protein
VVRAAAALALLVVAAALLAGCGRTKAAAPLPPTRCTPGLELDRPGGHRIVCPPFTIRWVPRSWVLTRLPGYLFAAQARHRPRLMNLYATQLGGTYLTLAGLKASIRPELRKLFPGHVSEVRFARVRLESGRALLMTKPSAGPGEPAITVYFLLYDGTGYELDFESSGRPTRTVLGMIGRIANSLRFDGGAGSPRYDVVYTLGAKSSTDYGTDGSSVRVRFRYLWFSKGRWRVDAEVTNTSPGLLTVQFGLVLVRYPAGAAADVKTPAQQVRAPGKYTPAPPRAGLAPGQSWHGSAVGRDSATAGPLARAGIGFRTISPAQSAESNAVTAEQVVQPRR